MCNSAKPFFVIFVVENKFPFFSKKKIFFGPKNILNLIWEVRSLQQDYGLDDSFRKFDKIFYFFSSSKILHETYTKSICQKMCNFDKTKKLFRTFFTLWNKQIRHFFLYFLKYLLLPCVKSNAVISWHFCQ